MESGLRDKLTGRGEWATGHFVNREWVKCLSNKSALLVTWSYRCRYCCSTSDIDVCITDCPVNWCRKVIIAGVSLRTGPSALT